MSRVVITINGEPRAKGRPRVAMGRLIPDNSTAAEEVHIANLGRKAMRGGSPMVGPIRMRLEAVFEMPISWPKKVRDLERLEHVSKPDLDNIEKLVLDALNGIVYLDDAQICEVIKRKRYGLGSRVEVSLEELKTIPFHPGVKRAEFRRDNPLPPRNKPRRAVKPADKENDIGKRTK